MRCLLVFTLIVALSQGVAGFVSPLQACVNITSFPFCDIRLSRDARIQDVMSRMSISDKISFMGNTVNGDASLGLVHYDWWNEALHGVNANCMTVSGVTKCPSSFPAAISMGASFNMDLVLQVGTAISDEARAFFNNGGRTWLNYFGLDVWAPNINIFRDPRWGRGQETPGEDPYLTGRYAVNYIHGLQDSTDPRYLKLVATAKHFVAYSLENWNGQDRSGFSANVTDQDLQQTFYPAFETAVKEGKVHGIMCSYNAENGVPSCANTKLLNDTLRNKWGFDGYVTGDCAAVQDVYSAHHYTSNVQQAAAATLIAGTDTDCGSVYQADLASALSQGLVTEANINTALYRLFDMQFRTGLFDPVAAQPYSNLDINTVDSPAHRSLARQIAHEGIVLLQNEDNLLPLVIDPRPASSTRHSRRLRAGSLNIALVGPMGAATDDLTSNYHGSLPHVVSILEAFQAQTGVSVTYAQGCTVTGTNTSGIAAAVTAAKAADVAVVAIGINGNIEAEGLDRKTMALPGVQDQLIAQVIAVQPNTIIVIINGGMVGMDTILTAPAVLEAFYPGEEGGNAVADVIFGRYNPSGRLPVTIYPMSFQDQADFTNYDMRKAPGLTYRFYQSTPVFEFGFGLSYTMFQYKMLTASQTVSASLDASTTFEVQVMNTGDLAGHVSVLGFLSLSSNSVSARRRHHALQSRALVNNDCPLKQLFGFQKIYLEPGTSAVLTFAVSPADALCVNTAGDIYAVAGTYTVSLGEATGTLIVS